MPQQKSPHILLPDITKTQSYTPKGGGSSEYTIPEKIPNIHGEFLRQAYGSALENFLNQCQQYQVSLENRDKGFTIEVQAPENIDLEFAKLEDSRGSEKLEILNVKLDDQGKVTSAVIYIPPKKKENLEKKINAYQDQSKNTKNGARHRLLFNTVENLLAPDLLSFWTDNMPFPDEDSLHDWELWLRDNTFENVREVAESIDGINLSEHHLRFPDRQICTAHCDLNSLQKLRLATNALTGFRYNRTQSGFFAAMEPREQREWQDELSSRIHFDFQNSSVCILDTGVQKEHPLLQPAIQENGVDSYHPDWGKGDHNGHGTEMAGLALLGDLTPLLDSDQRVDIRHYIESVKVFPLEGQNADEHVAAITEESVYRAETNYPNIDRVFCLSWTVTPPEIEGQPTRPLDGEPTALSAKIDQMSFGTDSIQEWQISDEKKRLFFISAGNLQEALKHSEYPDRNDTSEIEEPAQSWNAITVGAYTNKLWVNDPSYDGWEPVAKAGELSPRSRTSVSWGKKSWPIKPDIVFEGGNHIGKEPFPPEDHPDLHPLTTGKTHPFCHSSDTSAANAQASRLAALVRAEYPNYWPETVRGLMVHAARWTPAMFQQWKDPSVSNVMEKITLLRRYGYGVPAEEKMLSSFNNQPCIIIQDFLKPFTRQENKSYSNYGEMNFYQLPWPKEQLENLFSDEVSLRITLSYFIEPSPSERPPKTKYSYASHELRFKLQRAGEEPDQFLQRINAELADDEANENDLGNSEPIETNNRGQDNWLLGPKTRDKGSLISDVWSGTGAELANQSMIAVIPQGGWWKYRLKFPNEENPRHAQKVRFSLILSLETEIDIDIYTPIIQQINTVISV